MINELKGNRKNKENKQSNANNRQKNHWVLCIDVCVCCYNVIDPIYGDRLTTTLAETLLKNT